MLNFIICLHIAAIVVLFVETVYVALQKASRMQVLSLVMTISVIITMTGYLVEIAASDLATSMAGVCFSYVGKPFALLTALLFVAFYCGYQLPRKLIFFLAVLHASFTGIVFTNSYHHLFYATVDFDRSQMFSPLILTHGPLYFVYAFLMGLYMLLNVIMAFREYRKVETKEAKVQIVYIFGLITSAALGYAAYLLKLTNGYDATLAGCTFGTVILLVLFFRYRLFDVLTLAKEQALNESHTGVFVFNPQGEITFANTVANELLKHSFSKDAVRSFSDKATVSGANGRIYSIQKQKIIDRGRYFGETVEAIDVTDSHTYTSQLEQAVEMRAREIQHIQRSILAGFANIVEARSGETGSHIKRTSNYVEAIAQNMLKRGLHPEILTEEYVARLIDVAPLHDIGKLSVPDVILNKPGKLTEEEFTIIKAHAVNGVKLIEENMRGIETDEYVTLAEEVALFHHEKWNGTGYPKGLSGEDIPLSGRIMAVADVYDAIRSKRCYKDALSPKESRQIILEGRGSHFDPDVVDAFFRCIDNIDPLPQKQQ